MRKLIVLAVLLTMTTGCGRGWFPHLFRGAPCNGLCSAPAAPQAQECENCAGYGAYEGGISTGTEYVDGGYIGTGVQGTYESIPSMTNIPNSGVIQGPIVPKQ